MDEIDLAQRVSRKLLDVALDEIIPLFKDGSISFKGASITLQLVAAETAASIINASLFFAPPGTEVEIVLNVLPKIFDTIRTTTVGNADSMPERKRKIQEDMAKAGF